MKRRLPPPLVALSPGDLDAAAIPQFLGKLRAAVGAGLAGVLVREPGMGDRALLELARGARRALPEDAWLGIHDRVHLAEGAQADAVHLGFRSLTPLEARRILPASVAIGFSAHAGDPPQTWDAADYLLFGPVRATGGKEPIGFKELARAVARSPRPIWAIGGIRAQDVPACLGAGCKGIAVRSGILSAADPSAACTAYLGARTPR